jgi:hypothetical protein
MIMQATILVSLTIPKLALALLTWYTTPVGNILGIVQVVANTPFIVNTNTTLQDCNLKILPVNTMCNIYYTGTDPIYLQIEAL